MAKHLPSKFTATVILITAVAGCGDEVPAPSPAPPAPTATLSPLPVEMNVRQRTTTTVDGSDGKLLLTIDDVTRGQVMTSLASDQGKTVLSTQSMKPGDEASFTHGSARYVLRLKAFNKKLAGQDGATFVISAATPAATSAVLTEDAKIERLMQAVADLKDAKFIRNGTEHTPAEAVEHMKRKRSAAGDKVSTARQFIDGLASKSSASGKPYEIRFGDGRTITAGEFFNQRLAEIEGGHNAN